MNDSSVDKTSAFSANLAMSELFWLPISLLVVISAVPLGKQEFYLNTRKHQVSTDYSNAFSETLNQNPVFYGDDEGRKEDIVMQLQYISINEDLRNSTVFREILINATENSVRFRRLNSWISKTYQMLKYEDVDFHSSSFVSDLKRHMSRSSLLTADTNTKGNTYVSYQKLLLESKKFRSLRVYKHKKNLVTHFKPMRKMSKYGKNEFHNTTPVSQIPETERVATGMASSMSCEHVSGFNTIRWLQMVVRCPASWTEDNTKFECETWNNLVLPFFNFLPFLPVQDARGIVYANVFCAQCHGIDDILPWTLKIACDNDNNEQTTNLELMNIASAAVLSQFLRTPICKRQVVPSLPDAIVPCAVHSPENNARKCPTPVCDVINSDYPVSFNVLMNFDFTGDTHLLFSASPRLTEEYIPRCREWETFDTYSQTCRPITCNKYYTLVGDRCIPQQHDYTPSDGITDPQELRSVDQTALVSLLLNVTYGDYLSFVLNNDTDMNIVHQLTDKLNISMERIKAVNVTFEFSSTNGTEVKVTTLTEEQYNSIFPPIIKHPDSTTEIPKQTDNDWSLRNNKSRISVEEWTKSNSDTTKHPGNKAEQTKNKSFLDLKALFSRATHDYGVKGEDVRKDANINSNSSDQAEQLDSNEKISRYSSETDKRTGTTRDSFTERKAFSKYVKVLKRAEIFASNFSRGQGFRKLRVKDKEWNDISVKGLDVELVVKNGSTYVYVSEPYNNKSDRIVLQADDMAAAAFMTGFELLEAMLKQTITMRVNFILVPPHDPHSNEDSLSTLLQKINTMIVQKKFSIKINGNDVDVIDADDKSDAIAEAEGFCPMGRDALFFDDEFVLVNINNQTHMYINSTESYIPVGRFDLWVVFAGNLADNETSLTGISKCAFVCFMPRILQTDCKGIDLESNEYYVIESNKSIIFEEKEYDFYSYRVVNESTGKIQICVPQSFQGKMQTMLPHIKFYGGCSHDFNTALKVEGYMTLVLGRISIAALACVLITYCLFSRLRNLPGINTMNLTLALLVAEVIFSEGINVSTHWLCSAVAMSIHFTFLASHFWMNVMSYDLYRTFANSQSTIPQLRDRRRYYPRYAAYAWGVPMLVVAFCAFIDFSNLFENISIGYGNFEYQDTNISNYDIITTQDGEISVQDIRNATADLSLNIASNSICWITKPLAALVSFGAPILLIFSINCVFFAKTILSISKTMKLTKRSITSKHSNSSFQKMSGRSDVMLYVKMSTVMGFTWIFGLSSSILSSFAKPITYSACIASHFLAICFTLFNASQGVFIFIAFVCNRRVLALYCSLFRRVKRFLLRKDSENRLSSVSTIESNRNAPASYTNRI